MVWIGVRRVVFVDGGVRGGFRERGVVLTQRQQRLPDVVWQYDGGEVDQLLRCVRERCERKTMKEKQTSKDWAYQFLTFLMECISLRLWGSSSSSLTL